MAQTNAIPADQLGQLIWWFNRRIESHRADLAKFAARFETDSLDAFEWGESAVTTAARLRYEVAAHRFLTGEVNSTFDGDRIVALRDEWEREFRRLARHQRQTSSSQLANLVEETKRIVLGQLLDELPPAPPKLAVDATELKTAIEADLTKRVERAAADALIPRNQKETRFYEGVAMTWKAALAYVHGWRPKDEQTVE